jgi:hypothetical protein
MLFGGPFVGRILVRRIKSFTAIAVRVQRDGLAIRRKGE